MKRQIRFGVFETNSSSVHSLTITDKETFEKFKNEELLISWRDKFIENNEENREDEDNKTYDDYGGEEYEYFEKEYKTESGDEVVVFGYYGENR